jgi:peptide/nickel transport system substrate-binding protein
MSKKTLLQQCFSVAVVAVVVMLGSSSAIANKADDTFRYATKQALGSVDPYFEPHRESVLFTGMMVWDTLIYRDPETAKYKPLLAKSWNWKNSTTIDFELRDDVKFHDGLRFSAKDVAYTLNYVSNPENKVATQSNVKWIKSAEVLSQNSVRLHLQEPFPAALEYLSALLPIMPVDFFGEGGVAGGNGRLVGTGPYKLKEFVAGTHTILEKNTNYFANSPKGMPQIGRVKFRTIPDSATQIAELLSGGLDWIWKIPQDQATHLAKLGRVAVKPAETMRVSFLYFDVTGRTGVEVLKDIRVRQAFAHGIDREAIVNHVIGSGSRVVHTPCYPTQFGCEESAAVKYEFNPEKAKRLLKEAGYEDGFELDMYTWRNREWSEAIAGYLQRIGIKVNVQHLPYAAVREKIHGNKVSILHGDWGSYSLNDVSAIINVFFTQSKDDYAMDDELTGWINRASASVDANERQALYRKAVERITSEVYWLPMYIHPATVAHSNELNYTSWPDENPRFFMTSWKN